jgi:hypothetical protein
MTLLSILDPKGIMIIWKARSWTIRFMMPLRTNMESQVMDYLVHDTFED